MLKAQFLLLRVEVERRLGFRLLQSDLNSGKHQQNVSPVLHFIAANSIS